jgi:hypothetical protein
MLGAVVVPRYALRSVWLTTSGIGRRAPVLCLRCRTGRALNVASRYTPSYGVARNGGLQQRGEVTLLRLLVDTEPDRSIYLCKNDGELYPRHARFLFEHKCNVSRYFDITSWTD